MKKNRFDTKPAAPPKPKLKVSKSTEKLNKMIAPAEVDEQKLDFIKGRMKVRPLNATQTKPLPKRTKQLASAANNRANSSSDDTNSVFNRPSNPQYHKPNRQISVQLPKHNEASRTNLNEEENIDPNQPDVDCISVTSSEWGDENKIEKENIKKRRHHHSADRTFVLIKIISIKKPKN